LPFFVAGKQLKLGSGTAEKRGQHTLPYFAPADGRGAESLQTQGWNSCALNVLAR
jgi:hypothetical protein